MSPLAVARRSTLAAVSLSGALAIALTPRIAPLEAWSEPWTRAMWIATAIFAAVAWAWTQHTMSPTVTLAPASQVRRRLAHDFPFRLARLIFVGALGAGVATTAWLWPRGSTGSAIVTGAIAYLLLLLPVMPVYLIARRALRPDAAGPPGAPPVRALRQSVGLRLVFAVQLPVVVCAVGIVLVEQDEQGRYHADLEAYYRGQYARVANRTLDMLPPAAQAAAQAELALRPGVSVRDGLVVAVSEARVGRALELRLPPFILLALVLLLSARLGRWLASEVTLELQQVRGTLALSAAHPSQQHDAALETAVGLRETHELMEALNHALSGFRARRRAMARAAEGRRRAELAKSRFLAHLSHELKSPLNSILGFAEVLLCEIDGPLDPRQRDRLSIVWRSGDSLLRFILVLLDKAQLETSDQQGSGLDPRPITARALDAAIEQNLRIDPTGELDLAHVVAPDAPDVDLDAAWIGRALLYLAGLLQECMERGTARIELTREGDALRCTVSAPHALAAAQGEDLRRLRAEVVSLGLALDRGATVPLVMDDPSVRQRVLVTMRLVNRVVASSGGRLHIEDGEWPRFVLRFPALRADDAG